MKKHLCTTVLLMLTIISAQDSIKDKFAFGIKGGVSFNHFLGDIPIDFTPQLRTGFTAGVFGKFKLSDNFSVQPEVLYSQKGSNFKEFEFEFDDFTINNLKLDMYIESTWIEISILGVYHMNDEFALFCGPYLGFYLNGSVVAEPTVSIFDINFEYDIEADDLNLPDYGVVLGAMYNLSDKLAIQARWDYGIQDLADEIVNFYEDEVIAVNNSSFQLQFAIII